MNSLRALVLLPLVLASFVACGTSEPAQPPPPAEDASIADDAGAASEDGGSDAGLADAASPDRCSSSADCSPGLTCEAMDGVKRCLVPASPPVKNLGGQVLPAMEVWTVVWAGDEAAGVALDGFRRAFLASTSWTSRVGEYGIGPGKAMGVIVLPGAAPARFDGSEFETLVPTLVGMKTLDGNVVPAPNPNTVFGFLVPKSSREPDGTWHDETTDLVPSAAGPGIHVPYIVDEQEAIARPTEFDYLTWSDSHELVETASDPHTTYAQAFAVPWMNSEGEIADLCSDIEVREPIGGQLRSLTRVYSAKLAAERAGDPCVPALPGTYSNVAFTPSEVIVPRGIGQTATLHLKAFTTGTPQTLNWELYGDDTCTFSPASGTIRPGDDVAVTVKRVASSPGWTTALTVWVTLPSDPDADPPFQEWIGGLSDGR